MTSQFNVPANLFDNADVQSNKMPDFIFNKMVCEASWVFQYMDFYGMVGPNRANFQKALLKCQKLNPATHAVEVRSTAKNDDWVVLGITEMAKHYAKHQHNVEYFFLKEKHEDVFGFGRP